MKKIGFIGVGIMGKSMVRNLMKTGYELHIYARTKAKVDDVISEGAIFHESIKECVPGCDAVITIVGFPRDVEEVYFDEGGILENADPGTYLIDMTTTSPKLDQQIYEEAKKRGLHGLDAPVTGGDSRIPEQKTLHYPSLSAARKKIMKLVWSFSKQWEQTSIIREKPDVDSMQSLLIRL